MSEIKDGGPAFPMRPEKREPAGPDGWELVTAGDYPGMSLRDYFAAKAMQGICSGEYMIGLLRGAEQAAPNGQDDFPELLASISYEYADAMLAARQK